MMSGHCEFMAWYDAVHIFGTPDRPREFHDSTLWPRSKLLTVIGSFGDDRSIVLLTPKEWVLTIWPDSISLPDGFLLCVTEMFVCRDIRRALKRTFSESVDTLLVINDVDPVGIAQWFSIKYGLDSSDQVFDGVTWGGVSDCWLDLISESLVNSRNLESLLIPMSDEEIECFSVLKSLVPIESLLGPRCTGFLNSGRKLEIEAAINPSLFRPGYYEKLFHLLRNIAGMSH